MPHLRYGGFFHLNVQRNGHPVGLLEDALLKSNQGALFRESILVLPEAFNIIENYEKLDQTYVSDMGVEKRLIALSGRMGLCFVVGLIRNDETRHSEAILIDGTARRVLSRKTQCDGSPCYVPYTQPDGDNIILHRNLRIGALICMDATDDDKKARDKQQARHAAMVTEFVKCAEATLLCVPARSGSLGLVEVVKSWNRKVGSIIVANGGTTIHPSALHFENGQTYSAPTDGHCHVHLATLPGR